VNTVDDRVDRVLSFFSSRPNWDSPTPSPAGKRALPFGSGGEGIYSLAGEGVGEPQFQRRDRHCGTLGVYVFSLFCVVDCVETLKVYPSPQSNSWQSIENHEE
jgi:hypothetical protein